MAAPPSPFVVFCQPRSGSYHVVALLDSAADVRCCGELFKPNVLELEAPQLAALGVAPADTAVRDADPLAWVARVRALAARPCFGFKLFSNHVVAQPALRRGVLLAPGWRKLVLRRDPVRTYASLLRAQRTGVWTLHGSRPADAALLAAPVRFDAQGWEQHLRQAAKFERQVEAAATVPGAHVHVLHYERLVGEHGAGELVAALRFVGSTADPATLRSDRERQFRGDFRAGFENWPAFEAAIRAAGLPVPAAGESAD